VPEEHHDSPSLHPSTREELVQYLEAVIRLTDAEDNTAGFLLRLVVRNLSKPPQIRARKIVS
jgi:hypothetical protein